MSVHNKSITTEGVAPCPLCGTKVQIVSEGKLCCFVPEEDLPVYNVRCKVECPTDFLTLDLGWSGYADTENKTEQEQRGMLSEIMRFHAEQTRKIWNRRAGNSQPVRHGRWGHRWVCSNMTEYEYACSCSECGKPTYRISTLEPMPPYCPNCGAKMDEEGEE